MKKISLKPGFEIIFSLSLVAVLGLPLLVLGQTQKNIRIEIVNGDTTINGKNIKKLSAAERKDALAEMDNMGNRCVSLMHCRSVFRYCRWLGYITLKCLQVNQLAVGAVFRH